MNPWQHGDIERVTDGPGHHAFTSLVALPDGTWCCAFRRGEGHVSHDGQLVLSRRHPVRGWETWHEFSSPRPDLPDLRDPALCRVGAGLVLAGTATRREPDPAAQAFLWRWHDIRDAPVGPDASLPANLWSWDLAATEDELVTTVYPQRGTGGEVNGVALWHAPLDSNRFLRAEPLIDGGQEPNETGIAIQGEHQACLVRHRWTPDKEPNGAAVLLRRDDDSEGWRLAEAEHFIGGPNLLFLPDGRLLAAGRRLRPTVQTVVWEIVGDEWVERVVLPSNGADSSYPSMAVCKDGFAVTWYTDTTLGCQVHFTTVTVPDR